MFLNLFLDVTPYSEIKSVYLNLVFEAFLNCDVAGCEKRISAAVQVPSEILSRRCCRRDYPGHHPPPLLLASMKKIF